MRVLIVVLTCLKNRHRLEQQYRRWLGPCPFEHVELLAEEQLESAARLDPPRLLVRCRDNYESLPQKVLLAYQFLSQRGYDYVFKVDDDTICHTAAILPMLQAVRGDYIGRVRSVSNGIDPCDHYGKVEDPALNIPWVGEAKYDYCSGPGYFLSARALSVLARHVESDLALQTARNHMYEDVMIGEILAQNGIYPTPGCATDVIQFVQHGEAQF